MNKNIAIIYFIWATALIATGIFIIKKINDTSNPSSLSSSLKNLKEIIDEDSKVP